MLVGVLSGTPNTGAKPAPITDAEKLQEALKVSYVNLQKAITGLSDNDLQAPVKLFGRDMTKLGALMLILEDQHEHLGQSIAYARTKGVVPPWSKWELPRGLQAIIMKNEVSKGEGHRRLPSLFRLLLVCSAQMFLVASAGGQDRNSGSPAVPGCPDNVHPLPTQSWVRDMQQKNFRGIKKLLSTDILFSDNGKTFRGLAAVTDAYRRAFATFDSHLTMSPTAHLWDDAQRTCTETGTFEENLRTKSGGTTTHYSGGYVFAFRLVGKKRWEMSRQEWTTAADLHPAQDNRH